jgi:hypothetical protein
MNILSSNNVALLFIAFCMLLVTGEIAVFAATTVIKNRVYLMSALVISLFSFCFMLMYALFNTWWNYESTNYLMTSMNTHHFHHMKDYDDWFTQIFHNSVKYYNEGMV